MAVTRIDSPTQPCKEHLEIWYRFETDHGELRVDLAEFNQTSWVTLATARQMITVPSNLEAMDRMEQLFAGSVNKP